MIGNYIGYNVALIEDSIAEKLNLDNIQFRILPSEDVALCYKFAGMEGGYISVKKGNDAETIDPHIQQICNSMEQLGDIEKVKYNFTDDGFTYMIDTPETQGVVDFGDFDPGVGFNP